MINKKLIEIWKKQGKSKEQIQEKMQEMGRSEVKQEHLFQPLKVEFVETFDFILNTFYIHGQDRQKKLKDFTSDEKIELIRELQHEGIVGKDIIVEKIIERIREPITPFEKLEYQRQWRMKQALMKKEVDLKKREMDKIEQAMKNRKTTRCYKCDKQVPCVDKGFNLEKKKNDKRFKLIITSVCPFCNE